MAFLQNATSALVTPTHDGSGQATHPSVIDFQVEHGIASWSGYRYWMAMTPYPWANANHEDPNLLASQDGITWVVPNGLVNPLDNLVTPDYNADTDMIYDPAENCLRIYYRAYLDAIPSTELRMIKVYSDMTFTAPIVSIELNPWSQAVDKIRSQCIWREAADKWHMWANGGSRPYKFWYLFSVDGVAWSEPVQVLDTNGLDPFAAKGYENWHPSCKPNYEQNRIEFMTVDFPNDFLIYSQIPMDNLTLMEIPEEHVILQTGLSGNFDDSRLYRSSFVKDGDNYKVWYSGIDSGNKWWVGLTEGILPSFVVEGAIPLGYIKTTNRTAQFLLPIYQPEEYPDGPCKMFINNQTGVFKLVGADDPSASPLRVYSGGVVKAVSQ